MGRKNFQTLCVLTGMFGVLLLFQSHAVAREVEKDLEALSKVAEVIFDVQDKWRQAEEELGTLARTRAAPRVRRNKQKVLNEKKSLLEQKLRKYQLVFRKYVQSFIFKKGKDRHQNGLFKLSGPRGAIDCFSDSEGVSGQCTIESENISFKW